MFIAMNRFKVQKGSEEAFENIWRNRDSSLAEMEGFEQFLLLRGGSGKDQQPRAQPDGGYVRLDHQRLADRFHRAHHVQRAAAEAAVP